MTRLTLCGGRFHSCKVLPGCVGYFPEKSLEGGYMLPPVCCVSLGGPLSTSCLSVLPHMLKGSAEGSDTSHMVMAGPARGAIKGRSGRGWPHCPALCLTVVRSKGWTRVGFCFGQVTVKGMVIASPG